jgi:hypothetical protein
METAWPVQAAKSVLVALRLLHTATTHKCPMLKKQLASRKCIATLGNTTMEELVLLARLGQWIIALEAAWVSSNALPHRFQILDGRDVVLHPVTQGNITQLLQIQLDASPAPPVLSIIVPDGLEPFSSAWMVELQTRVALAAIAHRIALLASTILVLRAWRARPVQWTFAQEDREHRQLCNNAHLALLQTVHAPVVSAFLVSVRVLRVSTKWAPTNAALVLRALHALEETHFLYIQAQVHP